MDPFDWMIGDTIEHLAQVILGIEHVQLGGLCRAPNYADRTWFPQSWL